MVLRRRDQAQVADASSRALIATLAPFGSTAFFFGATPAIASITTGAVIGSPCSSVSTVTPLRKKGDALAFLVIGTLDHLGQAAGGRLGDVHGGVDRAEPCAVVSWSPEQSS
jgi:hypothetical protein